MAIDPDRLLPGGDLDRIIRGVVGRVLRSSADDQEDVRSDVVLLLVRKLHQLDATASAQPIENLPAYVATLAHHACYGYLRRRRPQWMRLRNQVRYLVGHDADLCVEHEDERAFCVARAPRLDGGDPDLQRLPLRDLAKVLIAGAGGRMALDELVSAVAEVRGVRDADTRASRDDIDRLADPRIQAGIALDNARHLQRVWVEVRQLPLRQRWALLLNLRNTSGQGLLALLPLTGTATIRQIAEVLELPAQELARLWKELPMDDRSIALRLGLSRQQVINLRKSARERLRRRLTAPSSRVPGNMAPDSEFFMLRQNRSVHRAP